MELVLSIPTVIANTSLSARNHYNGPFISAAGGIYGVFRHRTNTDELRVYKAADPPASFSEQDGSNRPVVAAILTSVWAFQDGDDLHIAHQEVADGHVGYSVFHMATDAWDGTLNDLLVETPSDPLGAACSIAVRSDGDVIVLYQGNVDKVMGTDRSRVDYGRKENGTFATVGVAVDNGGATSWNGAVIVPGSSDRMHFFFKDKGATDGYQRTLLSDNSLETFPSAGDTNVATVAQHVFVKGMSYDDGGTQRIRCPYKDNNGQMSYAEFDSADAPGAFSVNANVSDNDVNSTSVRLAACSAVNEASTVPEEYLLYSEDVTQDLFVDEDDGTDFELIDAQIIEFLSCNVYTREAQVVGFFYQNDGSGVAFNELLIGAPGAIRQYFHRYLRGDQWA